MALAVEVARLQSSFDPEQRLSSDLVEELLAGTESDERRAIVRAQLLGHDLQAPNRVLVITQGGEADGGDGLFHAVRRSARDLHIDALLSPRVDAVVMVAAESPGWDRLQTAIDSQMSRNECHIGVGRVCHRVGDYPQSYRQARDALRLQSVLPMESRTTVFDELGVFRLFAEIEELSIIRDYIREWLGPLIDYDIAKGTELVTTLAQYLETGGSYDTTSQSLILHRSTLRYRLRRIKEISGFDLSQPDTRFNLQLAARALDTLTALGDVELLKDRSDSLAREDMLKHLLDSVSREAAEREEGRDRDGGRQVSTPRRLSQRRVPYERGMQGRRGS
jgi:DNA-binding PucR family transcriptional regulator